MGSESIPVDYTPAEMMTAVAARELRDGEVVFVGIGLPNLACNLARATHAPNLVLIYESGAVGAVPERQGSRSGPFETTWVPICLRPIL